MSFKEAKSRFYHACRRCTAKWYAPMARMQCPRCGAESLSTERMVPPWMRGKNALEPVTPAITRRADEATDKTENNS